MKFVLLVEGQTERDSAANFLKRWLDPQLGQPVGIQSVAFDGYADLVRKVATKAKMYLEGRKQHEIIAVIGLLDLNGPQFYPGHLATVRERHEWGVAHFQTEVGFDRFRMYFAVHEFEAWLLAQPEIFPREIRGNLPERIAHPETVNFGEPPAKLLDKVYKQTARGRYKKTAYGKQLFSKLDPNTAAQKCPYLKSMPDDMLALARQAGL